MTTTDYDANNLHSLPRALTDAIHVIVEQYPPGKDKLLVVAATLFSDAVAAVAVASEIDCTGAPAHAAMHKQALALIWESSARLAHAIAPSAESTAEVTKLRDRLTEILDAPRLAALTTTAADRTARGVHLYTAPQPFDFASALDQVYLDVSDAYDEYGHIADEFTAKMEANRDAIEARLTAAWDAIVVEFGLHVELAAEADLPDIEIAQPPNDEREPSCVYGCRPSIVDVMLGKPGSCGHEKVEIAPPPAPVDPREAEVSVLWLTQPVRCVSSGDPRMHARCGWVGVGADVARSNPRCPTCGAGVDAVPRYVVGTVDAAPDGTLVAVLLGDGVGIANACREFNRDQSAASEVTWHRPADGFCSDLRMIMTEHEVTKLMSSSNSRWTRPASSTRPRRGRRAEMARISEALRESAMEVLLVAFHYDGVVENPTVCAAWSLGASNDADELAYAAFRDVYNGLRRTERPMGTKECRLEAASLLRDGWSPGNPVRRLKRKPVRS